MLLFKKINFNINNNKMQKSNLRVSHVQLLKHLTKTVEWTSKHVTKVIVTENEIRKPKIYHEKAMIQLNSCSKCCPLATNARPQPWAPLVDSFIDDTVLQFGPDGRRETLHWKPFHLVLLACCHMA